MKKPMKNKIIIIINIIILFLFFIVGFWFSKNVVFKDLEPLIAILQSTSAMVFTIMGIWIAYIYPNAILKITQPKKVEAIFSNEDGKRIKLLVGIVILSATVLVLLLLGLSIKVFFTKTDVYINNYYFFDSIAISLFLVLIYIQLICIYTVIASCVNFIIDINNLEAKRELNKKLEGIVDDKSIDP